MIVSRLSASEIGFPLIDMSLLAIVPFVQMAFIRWGAPPIRPIINEPLRSGISRVTRTDPGWRPGLQAGQTDRYNDDGVTRGRNRIGEGTNFLARENDDSADEPP